MPETHVAHCGACAGRMILVRVENASYCYRCMACSLVTEPRVSADLAAEDVVWVPVKQALKYAAVQSAGFTAVK